ncbi:serine-rich adhesin for platelets-like [Daphnia pulex]|uniref:serine-rich adhesin for platelets-like n=1 Tax=Daphnia pulex TaxID=6669 RepID=UPI001EDF9A41|nr:serine-rich adhesin for platelets-like [Daphnia pulex]XP_046447468.1 serine-rich adhesin for platelets-like [Daphnia pulex]XP_046447554.1 serine-rich adhesin for platelets-like [Daphnia pulex]XP_046447625.1 serine-rich adhesin for platelets-like [Daphnia pulex]XP_046447697.1 serine-rich adhesin for platelets-like [Daphnia pulex]XP_046447766.1 serine-rich adhesin for platelets-like [Daphnia pulex]XP_046447841.1 serine-rich adhesin for platelets-like [Daphnia pulex]
MLKWIAQKGNNPRSASPSRSNKTPDSIHDTSPWLTDDPLATINVNTILDINRKSGASRRKSKPDQVYSVTRMNPLFVDTPKEMLPTNLSEGEKRLMDDSRSSNRSEQCQTPSSSGYESADPVKRLGNTTSNHKNQPVVQQRHQRHHQQHLVELSPASDYRRQFVLGPRLDRSSPPRKLTPDVATAAAPDGPIRIGKANLLHHNSHYVTRIHMHPPPAKDITSSSSADEASKQKAVDDEWEKYEQSHTGDFLNVSSKIPHPVWPANNPTVQRNNASVATSAIVQQNENYVTKILIAPRTVEKNKDQGQQPEAFDSIVTDSLLVMTSYDDGQSIDDSTPEQIVTPESAAELSEIRQLSQTISQSRVVATVSRALSKSGSASSETSYPTTPSSKNTEMASSTASSASSSSSSSVGGSIARRISMMKERWDKSSRRRLLTESDDDDPAFLTRRLDHVYIPQNGDVNFSVQPRNNSNVGDLPFSYLAGVYHPATITEEVTANDSQVHAVIVPSDRMPLSHYDPFEQDRQSNSSSRSSGSRRVTFSADTVDNEQSTKSTNSTASGSSAGSITGSTASDKTTSNHCPNIMEELKLNPHYLPHRYQPASGSASDVLCSGGRLAGYYSYNLQAQLDNYNAKGQAEKVSTWEHYHGQDVSPSSSKQPTGPYSPVRPSSSGTVRLDPYNNLQFHPNYGAAACQERSICVDFTLDGVEEALLQRRSDSHKLRRRICCCFLLLLCLVVLVIVVIVISLYLSQGQRIFGSV